MNLVNKQDDVAVRLLHFVQHGFQPFLKLAAVFCAGNQCAHIQLDQFLFLQAERDVTVHDPPRDALDNRRLPDARFTDQHRVVLCFPRQDLDNPADFLIPADNRIDLAALDVLDQIVPVFLQRVQLIFRVLFIHLHSTSSFFLCFFKRFSRNSGCFQNRLGDGAAAEQQADQKRYRTHISFFVCLTPLQRFLIRLIHLAGEVRLSAGSTGRQPFHITVDDLQRPLLVLSQPLPQAVDAVVFKNRFQAMLDVELALALRLCQLDRFH